MKVKRYAGEPKIWLVNRCRYCYQVFLGCANDTNCNCVKEGEFKLDKEGESEYNRVIHEREYKISPERLRLMAIMSIPIKPESTELYYLANDREKRRQSLNAQRDVL